MEPWEIIQVNIWLCCLHPVWKQWAYLTWEEAEIMYLILWKLIHSILDETKTIKEWLHIKIFPDYFHHCNLLECNVFRLFGQCHFFQTILGNAYCWSILLIPNFYVITSYSSRLRTDQAVCMKFTDNSIPAHLEISSTSSSCSFSSKVSS